MSEPTPRRPSRWTLTVVHAAAVLFTTPGPIAAQQDSATVVAGSEYRAGEPRETLLGEEYRDLWTVPVRVPVLDLDAFAGGLAPVRRGGGQQTISLRFEAANGREYNFRSVNKEITKGLPEWLKGTVVDWVLQDQTSSLHPAAAGVASVLLDSLDLLNPDPRLVVLPDDPRLGDFREEFAGVLGWIEIHPDEVRDAPELSFAGAVRVAGTDRVLEHLEEDPAHRVDSRTYLRARLLDLILGDWDRHEGQFRWARYDRGAEHWWIPIPEDRDYAFVDYDGVLPWIAKRTFVPRANPYRPEIRDDLLPLVISADEMDRRFLSELPWEVWDSTASLIQARLSEAAIEDALREMPPAWYERSGERLEAILRGRREDLREATEDFYELVMTAPLVFGTDEPELAVVERLPGGSVTVRIGVLDDGARGRPYFERTFHPDPTREIRLFLRGGDDRLLVRGAVERSIRVRAVGGGGDDVLVDSSRVAGATVLTALYDNRGENRFVAGPNTSVDTSAYEPVEPVRSPLSLPSRNWGSSWSWFSPWLDYRGDAGGLVIGGGPSYTRYGFRQEPYSRRLSLRAMVAPNTGLVGAEFYGDFRRVGSAEHLTLRARGSQLETLRFYGFGGASPAESDRDRSLVQQSQALLEAQLHLPLGDSVWLSFGPVAKYTDTDLRPGTVVEELRPYGTDPFGQVGARSELRVSTADDRLFPRRGLQLQLRGSAYPAAWHAVEPFGGVRAVAAAYATLPVATRPVLAVRAGGGRVFGRFPLHEAVFLGGSATLRGYPYQRFAGEGMLHGSAELRLPIAAVNLLVRGHLGVTALADAGRVYYAGDTAGGWHGAAGGGLWFASPGPVVNVSYAVGEEGVWYLRLGMPF